MCNDRDISDKAVLQDMAYQAIATRITIAKSKGLSRVSQPSIDEGIDKWNSGRSAKV